MTLEQFCETCEQLGFALSCLGFGIVIAIGFPVLIIVMPIYLVWQLTRHMGPLPKWTDNKEQTRNLEEEKNETT